jgi:hypothetical protein
VFFHTAKEATMSDEEIRTHLLKHLNVLESAIQGAVKEQHYELVVGISQQIMITLCQLCGVSPDDINKLKY